MSGKQMGMKFDQEKLEWSLLPIEQIEVVIKVLMKGAEKYQRDNWKYVKNAKVRYMDAAMRHLTERIKGEILDPEWNYAHTAHAICCLLFLMWFDDNGEK